MAVGQGVERARINSDNFFQYPSQRDPGGSSKIAGAKEILFGGKSDSNRCLLRAAS